MPADATVTGGACPRKAAAMDASKAADADDGVGGDDATALSMRLPVPLSLSKPQTTSPPLTATTGREGSSASSTGSMTLPTWLCRGAIVDCTRWRRRKLRGPPNRAPPSVRVVLIIVPSMATEPCREYMARPTPMSPSSSLEESSTPSTCSALRARDAKFSMLTAYVAWVEEWVGDPAALPTPTNEIGRAHV